MFAEFCNNAIVIHISDAVRLVCAVLAGITIGQILSTIRHGRSLGMTRRQRARFKGLALFILVTGVRQFQRVGDPLSWTLPVLLIGLCYVVEGLWGEVKSNLNWGTSDNDVRSTVYCQHCFRRHCSRSKPPEDKGSKGS